MIAYTAFGGDRFGRESAQSRIVQGGGVPSWHRGAPSFCGVEPWLSSCGIFPLLVRHPERTKEVNNNALMSFTVRSLARARLFA